LSRSLAHIAGVSNLFSASIAITTRGWRAVGELDALDHLSEARGVMP